MAKERTASPLGSIKNLKVYQNQGRTGAPREIRHQVSHFPRRSRGRAVDSHEEDETDCQASSADTFLFFYHISERPVRGSISEPHQSGSVHEVESSLFQVFSSFFFFSPHCCRIDASCEEAGSSNLLKVMSNVQKTLTFHMLIQQLCTGKKAYEISIGGKIGQSVSASWSAVNPQPRSSLACWLVQVPAVTVLLHRVSHAWVCLFLQWVHWYMTERMKSQSSDKQIKVGWHTEFVSLAKS